MIKKNRSYRLRTIIVSMACLINLPALAAEPVVVNVDNFVRAETAVNFDKTLPLNRNNDRRGMILPESKADTKSILNS